RLTIDTDTMFLINSKCTDSKIILSPVNNNSFFHYAHFTLIHFRCIAAPELWLLDTETAYRCFFHTRAENQLLSFLTDLLPILKDFYNDIYLFSGRRSASENGFYFYKRRLLISRNSTDFQTIQFHMYILSRDQLHIPIYPTSRVPSAVWHRCV